VFYKGVGVERVEVEGGEGGEHGRGGCRRRGEWRRRWHRG
jgi:hypothetical protein